MNKPLLIFVFLSVGFAAAAQTTQQIEININKRQMNEFETMKPVRSLLLINDSIVLPADETLNDSIVFTDVNFDEASKRLTFTQYSMETEESLSYIVSGVSTEHMKVTITAEGEESLTLKATSTMSCTNHSPRHTCLIKDMKKFSDAGCIF